ncbi:MAG: DNA-processing protein DprA [Verrucomicrobiota bacterium]|jgi:predicted Rossmann fold nucleotide-binding protein DprA/Smf involved in DNA uptake
MNVSDYLSDDGLALLALCSGFALPEGAAEGGATPFTLSEWNKLARQVHDSLLQQPAALQGRTAADLARDLAIPPDDAERIVRLLDRSGRLALELEGLFSRGLWAVTRADEPYPAKLRDTLKHQAPTVLFGAGSLQLLKGGGIAVIGSRNIDEAGTVFAQEVGRKAAAARLPVVSGGARGTDRLAMGAALEAGGIAFGILADSLERTVRQPDLRQLLLDGQLVLLTPYVPAAGFSVGAAMGRNKVIYGLADFAVVVSSDFQTGGTWAGAVEALKAGWCPVFARDGAEVPKGNRELLKLGAASLAGADLETAGNLPEWLREHARRRPVERDLFG